MCLERELVYIHNIYWLLTHYIGLDVIRSLIYLAPPNSLMAQWNSTRLYHHLSSPITKVSGMKLVNTITSIREYKQEMRLGLRCTQVMQNRRRKEEEEHIITTDPMKVIDSKLPLIHPKHRL